MNNINKSIFKSYDIRGVYPTEVDEKTAFIIGRAFARFTGSKNIVVGRDMRLGSFDLYKGFIKGVLESGINVVDLGLVPIDAVYFTIGKFNYDGGAMITASHNPKKYAGIKMIGKNFKWIRGKEILEVIEKEQINDEPLGIGEAIFGSVIKKDTSDEHVNHVLSFADIKKLKPLKVVVDAGNGMAGKMIPKLCANLPLIIEPLFFDMDGNFPNHPSDPLKPESQIAITKKIIETQADCGAIFDGDSDRVFFLDENGKFIYADITLLMLARHMLNRSPGSAVSYSLNCSRAVPEKIKSMGGVPIRARVGYVNVAQAAKEKNGIMGGELSGHYLFRDNFYADSGYIAFISIMQILSDSNQKISEIVKEFGTYTPSGEINFKTEKIEFAIQKIKEKYKDGVQDELDGLTVEYKDWWFLARPSNTEPLLRISLEGNTRELMEEKRAEIISFINSIIGS